MKDFTPNIESATLKARARVSAFNRKGEEESDPAVEKFKEDMVKTWMKYPEVFQALMKSAPKELADLVKRYG